MLTIKAKMPSASLAEIKQIAKGINEIEASSCENINLLLKVNQILLDGDKQNIVAVAANRGVINKG